MDKNYRTMPNAILRVKRKRNEEPLEALGLWNDLNLYIPILILAVVVYESTKRRKSRGGLSVFKLVETVEADEWTDDYGLKDIKVTFCHLMLILRTKFNLIRIVLLD